MHILYCKHSYVNFIPRYRLQDSQLVTLDVQTEEVDAGLVECLDDGVEGEALHADRERAILCLLIQPKLFVVMNHSASVKCFVKMNLQLEI